MVPATPNDLYLFNKRKKNQEQLRQDELYGTDLHILLATFEKIPVVEFIQASWNIKVGKV